MWIDQIKIDFRGAYVCVNYLCFESVSFTKSAQFLFTGYSVSSSQGTGLFLLYLFICSANAYGSTNPCLSRLSLQIIYFPYLRFMSAVPFQFIPGLQIALHVELLACCFHFCSMLKSCCQKLLYCYQSNQLNFMTKALLECVFVQIGVVSQKLIFPST